MENTTIAITTNHNGQKQLVLPQQKRGLPQFAVMTFMLAWLGGWAVGWVSAAHELSSDHEGKPTAFMAFWLICWTLGGGWVIFALSRMMRKPMPETLIVTPSKLVYDSGIAVVSPWTYPATYSGRDSLTMWKRMTARRTQTEFAVDEIKTLQLRDVGTTNRLTLDKSNTRLDIGRDLTEIDREWLYDYLKNYYNLEIPHGS